MRVAAAGGREAAAARGGGGAPFGYSVSCIAWLNAKPSLNSNHQLRAELNLEGDFKKTKLKLTWLAASEECPQLELVVSWRRGMGVYDVPGVRCPWLVPFTNLDLATPPPPPLPPGRTWATW